MATLHPSPQAQFTATPEAEAASASSGIVHRHQLGRFKLHLDLIQDHVPGVLQLFSKCVVASATLRLEEGAVEYLAYSEYFYPLALGQAAPEYLAVFALRGKGKFLGFTPVEQAGRRWQERGGERTT